MKLFLPAVSEGFGPEVDHLQVDQGPRHQEARQPLWRRNVALVHVESPTFLIGKERLNLRSALVVGDRLLSQLKIGHQGNRILMPAFMPENYPHGAVPLARYRGAGHTGVLPTAEGLEFADRIDLSALLFEQRRAGSATDVQKSQFVEGAIDVPSGRVGSVTGGVFLKRIRNGGPFPIQWAITCLICNNRG